MSDRMKIITGQERFRVVVEMLKELRSDSHLCFAGERLNSDDKDMLCAMVFLNLFIGGYNESSMF